MATGPEHYREAERLLVAAGIPLRSGEPRIDRIAAARVHATLALAAATALGRLGEYGLPYKDDRKAWVAAASEVPGANRRRKADREREAAGLAADGPWPPEGTCILTSAPGEDPDDCTTHRHETS